MKTLLSKAYSRILDLIQEPEEVKSLHELAYWETRKKQEGIMAHEHYVQFYTTHFGFDKSFYNGKKILDIGCGPRGSLEWANNAFVRIGIDTLADSYRKLGIHSHRMQYVAGRAEQLPFADCRFDVVTSFNSLDHVDDIDKTVAEITRVMATGGLFLLLTDVHHHPTICEPTVFSWNIVEKFFPTLKLIEEKQIEKSQGGMYESIIAGIPYDHRNKSRRYGILSAKFTKTS